jgi:hypothetical protein
MKLKNRESHVSLIIYYCDDVNEPTVILLLLVYPDRVGGCLLKYIQYRASSAASCVDLLFNIGTIFVSIRSRF